MARKTITIEEGFLENLPKVDEGESSEFVDDLLDLCEQEINYLLTLVNASAKDRIIIRLYLSKVSDKDIAEALSMNFGRDITAEAVKKKEIPLII